MIATHERIPTRISPDILDTIGKSFKFKHGKGAAEWLKNSLDNYLRLREQGRELRSGNWPVLIDLIDSSNPKTGPNLAVIDFGGTNFNNIEDFFLYWGSRSAATLGGLSTSAAVTGGHGNGGKFYMREMWRGGARFLTWRDDKATSLIVDKKDSTTTGEWEFKDTAMTWQDALASALLVSEGCGDADNLIEHLEKKEPNLVSELNANQRGLTVLLGRRAVQVYSANDVVSGGRWNFDKLIEEIRNAPQAHRPIRELIISVFSNGTPKITRIIPETIEEDPNWQSLELPLPLDVLRDVILQEGASSVGILRIKKSVNQLTGRLKEHNSVFIVDGANNPIAFYPLKEVPMPGHSPLFSFLYAELQLTFPKTDNLVENDRERLVPSPTTEAILAWIGEHIWGRTKAMEEAERDLKQQSELQIAAVLNDALNQHAKRFLQELQTQILIDLVEDNTGGGAGQSGKGTGPIRTGEDRHDTPPDEPPENKGGNTGTGGTLEVPGNTQPTRRPKFPQVLLSGIDADPARQDGTSKLLTDRHPPLEQEDIDKQHNVWWINTAHPFAQEALKHGGAKGNAFKSHQLFMFRDVVQREGLRILQRREAELGLDVVENELSEFSNRFLAELPHDLVEELLG